MTRISPEVLGVQASGDPAFWQPAADFAELQVSVLLIWGGDDPVSPPAVGRFLQQALPNAELAVIPNGGHDAAHSCGGSSGADSQLFE